MTSQNFLSKFLSWESLKVRVTWGLMAFALQSRCTVAFDTPASCAMVRTDQRVRCAGGRVAPTMIFSRMGGAICSFRPRPLASLSPATPAWRNRCSQWITTRRPTPTFTAVSCWLKPSARLSMIHARRWSRWATEGRLTMARNARRCSEVISSIRTGRGMTSMLSQNFNNVH